VAYSFKRGVALKSLYPIMIGFISGNGCPALWRGAWCLGLLRRPVVPPRRIVTHSRIRGGWIEDPFPFRRPVWSPRIASLFHSGGHNR